MVGLKRSVLKISFKWSWIFRHCNQEKWWKSSKNSWVMRVSVQLHASYMILKHFYLPSALISKRLKLQISGWSQVNDLFVYFPYLIYFLLFWAKMTELWVFLCNYMPLIWFQSISIFHQLSFLNGWSYNFLVGHNWKISSCSFRTSYCFCFFQQKWLSYEGFCATTCLLYDFKAFLSSFSSHF